ncbi:MAG: helix-turn-helix domain-containing protein [Clostridia bacterium]|nr:helix-turn-helix domain-containing protein [Clostridia bacterium]
MNVGSYIKELRTARNLTQEELGNIVGVQRAAVQKWESGKTRNLKRDTIKKLADFFGVDASKFVEDTPNIQPIKMATDAVKIPVFGYIPAGIPIEAIEDVLDYESIPADWMLGDKDYFALKIKGDSMFPNYLDGDVVIFEKTCTAENGKDVAVMINGGDATFKRLKVMPDGILLVPLNPNYETRFFKNEEVETLPVRIIGVAKELRRQGL